MKRKKVLAFMAAMVLGVGSIGSVPVYAEELEIGDKVIDPETGTEGVIVESPGNTAAVLEFLEENAEKVESVTAKNTIQELQARAANTPGQWVRESDLKWRWQYPNGIFATGEWICVSNQYYYIGNDSYMDFGWIEVDGETYYCGPSGAIYMNCWQSLNGKECWFNPSGYLRGIKLPMKSVHQFGSKWCWAASAEMVGSFGTSSTRTQWDVVKKFKGDSSNEYPNVSGDIDDTANAVEYVSNYTKNTRVVGDLPSFNTSKDWLFKHPFITMQRNVSIDHAMAAYGYYQDYSIWDEAWLYVDPEGPQGDNFHISERNDFKHTSTKIYLGSIIVP